MAVLHIFSILLGYVAFTNGLSNLCVNKSQSCDSFFPNDNLSCYITHYEGNSKKCQEMKFVNLQEHKYDLDEYPWVTIQTYNFKHIITGFNVTVKGDMWNHLKLRYENSNYNNHDLSNHCRELKFETNIGTIPLNYDCRWTKTETDTFTLEIQTDSVYKDSKHGKYIFSIPKASGLEPTTTIKNWATFIYIDVTDPVHPKAHVQFAPPRLNVTHYMVTTLKVNIEDPDQSVIAASWTLEPSDLNWFSVDNVDEYFQISVVPVDALGQHGVESTSPVVYRGNLKLGPITLFLVTAGAFLPACALGVLLWNRIDKKRFERTEANEPLSENMKKPPSGAILPKPTFSEEEASTIKFGFRSTEPEKNDWDTTELFFPSNT